MEKKRPRNPSAATGSYPVRNAGELSVYRISASRPLGNLSRAGSRDLVSRRDLVKAFKPAARLTGAALDLSHWKGNKTPEHLYADTSTEIALNYIRGGCEPQAGPLIVNNHFDSDGALAVWALLNTTEALAHADLLVAAASAGDFNEWQEGGMGVHLDAALEALAEASGGAGGAKYDAVLPQISELLRRCGRAGAQVQTTAQI